MNFPKYFQRLSEQEQAEWIEDKKEKARVRANLNYAVNYAGNIEKIRARQAKYRAENKEKKKDYRAKNLDKIKKYEAEYRAKNKDRTKKYNAKYYATKRKPKMLEQKAKNRQILTLSQSSD
jgi:hypothetical protein